MVAMVGVNRNIAKKAPNGSVVLPGVNGELP